MIASSQRELWRERLSVPAYAVNEAARYARLSTRTVSDWHKTESWAALSSRSDRAALSYLQLIEVAVVAAFKKAHVKNADIRAARDYMKEKFGSEHPFALYEFKRDGKRLVLPYEDVDKKSAKGKLLRPDQGGQLAWDCIVGRLNEFDYDHDEVVVRWHVAGLNSSVVIDPRIGFGVPTVKGTPTWIIKGRRSAGEPAEDIADDFGLTLNDIEDALTFESPAEVEQKWTH